MATTSEVKAGLDNIASVIAEQKAVIDKAKANAVLASAVLAAIPGDYADVISTIDGMVGSDPFEALVKDEKAKLQTEFTSLKALADSIGSS